MLCMCWRCWWGAVRRKTLGSTLKHMLLFGVPSAVIIVGALLPTFKTILTTDYADIYGAYYGGGFGNNCLGQLRTQGLIWLVLCAAGLVWSAVLPQHPCTGYCSRRGQPGGRWCCLPVPSPWATTRA